MKTFLQYVHGRPLTEAALNKSEIEKDSKKNPTWTRGKDLYDKIQRGEPFKTVEKSKFNGGFIEIDFASDEIASAFQNGNYDRLPKETDYFVVKSTNTPVRLTELEKTEEFGSSRGSGGGAQATVHAEVLQALFMSHIFNTVKTRLNDNNIDIDSLEKSYKYVSSKMSFQKLIETPEFKDEGWRFTFTQSANDFYSWYNANRNASGPFYFHRDSKFMNDIYDRFRDLKKKMGIKALNNDKWNPGDIWMANSKGHSIVTEKFNTLTQYNEAVASMYMSGDLMGISLKRLSGDKAKIKEFNVANDAKEKVTIRSLSLNGPTSRGSFFENKKLYVDVSNGKRIEFRAFGRDESFQAQIGGTAAAGGKMSLGPINDVLQMLNMEQLPEGKQITAVARKPTKRFYSDFYNLFKRFANRSETNISEDAFIDKIEGMEKQEQKNFRFSKYLSCRMYEILSKDKDKANELMNEILNYAASATSLSSSFVKIY